MVARDGVDQTSTHKHVNENDKTSLFTIDRFIIIHLGLLPGGNSGNGAGLDEAASIDELSEYILYYFDARSSSQSPSHSECDDAYAHTHASSTNRCVYNNESAIRFAGLCHALYSFPSSLKTQRGYDDGNGNGNGNNNDAGTSNSTNAADFTQEVQLSTCTLVFVPLEDTQTNGLFAVAQCPNHQNRDVNPTAIREYFYKYHQLFQLMKWGVHRCLSSFDPSKLPSSIYVHDNNNGINSHSDSRSYPGMEELYKKYKMLRKLNDKCDVNTSREHYEQIHQTQKMMEDFQYFLPINYIRKDLKEFYDWVILSLLPLRTSSSQTQSKPNQQHGQHKYNLQSHNETNLNFFEFLPPPFAIAVRHNEENNKSAIENQNYDVISKFESIFAPIKNKKKETLLNPFPDLIGFSGFCNGRHICTRTESAFNIPSLHACLVHKYFLTYMRKEVISDSENKKKHVNHSTSIDQNGFYISPPSEGSMKGTTSHFGEEIRISDVGSVWIPRIFLNGTISTKVVMYRQNDVDLIFYISCIDDGNKFKNTYTNNIQTLKDLAIFANQNEGLSSSKIQYNLSNNNFTLDQYNKLKYHIEPGLRVIYIDRSKDICVCLMNESSIKHLESKKKNFFSFPFLKGKSSSNKSNQEKQLETLHAFTSQIPKGVIPSLNEMLNEIHGMKSQNSDLNVYELCSLLPNNKGWIFGLNEEDDEKELYAFFNADIYFSITDVLKKVDKLYMNLINT